MKNIIAIFLGTSRNQKLSASHIRWQLFLWEKTWLENVSLKTWWWYLLW